MAQRIHETHPLRTLTIIFTLFKVFLLLVALGTSLTGSYDTSTSLFFASSDTGPSNAIASLFAGRLTRWDALYFVSAAQNAGKTYEQEWAFSHAPSELVRFVRNAAFPTTCSAAVEPIIAITVSHIAHYIGTIALYKLTLLISRDLNLAFVSSALHIISPAGIFLSAPYAESLFSCLSFIGTWVFALGYTYDTPSLVVKRSLYIFIAGILFMLATLCRSNGVASGLLFAVEAVSQLVNLTRRPGIQSFLSLIFVITGGMAVGVGFALPQYIGWVRFCHTNGPLRPWCTNTIPSMYGFVQEHYWNVGFLRYWTLNQTPLFLLASPTLAILITSGYKTLQQPSSTFKSLTSGSNRDLRLLTRAIAATQLFVALLAITNYHVQIITRLASGYTVWYWWVASCVIDEGERKHIGTVVVTFFVMYAGIQGALFASFLPPA